MDSQLPGGILELLELAGEMTGDAVTLPLFVVCGDTFVVEVVVVVVVVTVLTSGVWENVGEVLGEDLGVGDLPRGEATWCGSLEVSLGDRRRGPADKLFMGMR